MTYWHSNELLSVNQYPRLALGQTYQYIGTPATISRCPDGCSDLTTVKFTRA
jgi:hypothetical protein